MSAPAMRRSFSLHFNGGNTHVEADCTTSRTLAELLADSLFSAFPQFTSLRAAPSSGAKAKSSELEREMERWYVCKAPASTLTTPQLFLNDESGSLRGGRGRRRANDDLVQIPLSTATQIAPCDLFVVALGDSAGGAGGAGPAAGGPAASASSSGGRRGRQNVGATAKTTARGTGRPKATPASTEVPRPKRKYTRRATAAVAPVDVDSEDDDGDASGSGSGSSGDSDDSASASESGSSGSGSDASGRDVSDSATDGDSEEESSSAASEATTSATGSSGGGSSASDSSGEGSDGEGRTGRRAATRSRRRQRTESPPRTARRTGRPAKAATAAAPGTAVGPDGTVRTKRKYTRRAKTAAAGEADESAKPPAKRTRQSRTSSASRAPTRRRARSTDDSSPPTAASTPASPAVSTMPPGLTVVSRSSSGTPVLMTPDGQPIKRKRGRPPKNAQRYVEMTAAVAAQLAAAPQTPPAAPPGTAHPRANSKAPSEPVPLPSRRHRHRTRSPATSAIGADGSAPSNTAVLEAGEQVGVGVDDDDGARAPLSAVGATLSSREAQLRLLDQQRQRIADASAATGEGVGGGKSLAAAGGAASAEEVLRQAALAQEQQHRLMMQRRLRVRLHEYTIAVDGRLTGAENVGVASCGLTRSHRSTSGNLGTLLANGFVDGEGQDGPDALTSAVRARVLDGGGDDSPVRLLLRSGDSGAHRSHTGMDLLFRSDSAKDAAAAADGDRGRATRVPRCFELTRLLQEAGHMADTDAVAAATTAKVEGQTPSFLLSHPLACQAIPEVSLYGGLATACEVSMLTSAADAPPQLLPEGHDASRSTFRQRTLLSSAKAKRESELAHGSASPRPSAVKEESQHDDDDGDGAGARGTAAAVFGYPSVSPFALLDRDELAAMATGSMFHVQAHDTAGVVGDGAGDEGEEEAAQVLCCEPSRVSLSVPVVVGGCVRLVNPESREKSHQWTVYIRGLFNGHPPTSAPPPPAAVGTADSRAGDAAVHEEEGDYLSSFVDHVTFILDKSFNPCVRTVYKAPFEITEVGWGEFVVSIHVHLRLPGFNAVTRAMKRTLRCYLSGSGGRAALVASTGPGRGASGLDPVTSMHVGSPSGRGAHLSAAANADTNMLVDSFLDVNFNSAARSLLYRGPFLPPHLHSAEGCSDGGATAFLDVGDSGLRDLLRDYLRDRAEECDDEERPDDNDVAVDGIRGHAPNDGGDSGVKRESSQTPLLARSHSEDGGGGSGGLSARSSSLASPTSSSAPNTLAADAPPGSAFPAAPAPRRRGPRSTRRGGFGGRSASQSQAGAASPNSSGAVAGASAAAPAVLRVGHRGNVVVLSHLLRFSHRQRAAPLIPPHGDIRAPKRFEHLGYTLVTEPVVTESYDELVIPLQSLTHSRQFARQYAGLTQLLRKEEERHGEMVAVFEKKRRGDGFVKQGEEEEASGGADHLAVVAAGLTETEHAAAIRQCEERITTLQKLLVEFTRVVRADRRLLRSAAILEGKLRDALQAYLLSHRLPAADASSSTQRQPFLTQLHHPSAAAGAAGDGSVGGVTAWPAICVYGNAVEKDVLLTLSFLASVATSALGEGWLAFALLQARQRVFPYLSLTAATSGGRETGGGAGAAVGLTRGTVPVGRPVRLARVKHEEDDEGGDGDGGGSDRKGMFTQQRLRQLAASLHARLRSSSFPLTDLEYDCAAATLLAAVQGQQGRTPSSGASNEPDAVTTETASLFATELLPAAMELGAAVLSLRQTEAKTLQKGTQGRAARLALSSAFFSSWSAQDEGGNREDRGRRVECVASASPPLFPLYTDRLPGTPSIATAPTDAMTGVTLDPFTGTVVHATPHTHGGHSPSKAQLAAAASAASAALLRSRGLLPPLPDGLASRPGTGPHAPHAAGHPPGTGSLTTFASGETKLQFGEAADVAHLRAMKAALEDSIHQMRAEAARRQAALTLRQV